MQVVENLIDLWQEHWIIGSIIGVIIIAFLYELYMTPFRIRDYIVVKTEAIKRNRVYKGELLTILTLLVVQQDSKFRTDTKDEYLEMIQCEYERIKNNSKNFFEEDEE